jgi:hypothetical protein
MLFAYADPPYPGRAYYYSRESSYAGEVDHKELVDRLVAQYPDGWALSTSSPSLADILPLCPEDVRVMAWVKPFASFKPNINPAYAWEPVIVRGGRPRGRNVLTIRDWCSANIALKKGLVGAKPETFCHWILDVLNVLPEDRVVDLYPGTGVLRRCVDQRNRQLRLGQHEPVLAQDELMPG